MNCKTPDESFAPTFTVVPYSGYNFSDRNIIPMHARWQLFGLLLANSAVNWFVQYVGIVGPIRSTLRTLYPIQKPELPL